MSVFFFFKQKTAYEMRISDWSSDVCSSDLACGKQLRDRGAGQPAINDHGDTGWDKERGFGTGGDQTDGEPLRVPVLAQLRIHNAPDRRHGGGSRDRHRAEPHGGRYRGAAHPPTVVTYEDSHQTGAPRRALALYQGLPGQNKERYRHQHPKIP